MVMSMSTRRFNPIAFSVALATLNLRIPGLARVVGTNERYMRSIANGMVPGEALRAKVSAALGLPQDELFPVDPIAARANHG
jgi:hypothetical protein